jgi:hypothetical protein
MLRMSMSRVWPVFIAGVLLQASAQVPAPPAASTQAAAANPTSDRLVDELVENAARDHATLPSLTAHESIVSKVDEVVVFGKNTAKAEATVRIVRKSPEGPWTENREITVLNGKPVTPNTRTFLPFNLTEGFNDTQSLFFSVQNRPCYNFALAARAGQDAPLELTITPFSEVATRTQCIVHSGVARIDPETHHLTHLEFTNPAGTNSSQFFGTIDYAATRVGDKIFWLPSLITARVVIGKTPYEWSARYSDYHQYAVTLTILPADSNTQ